MTLCYLNGTAAPPGVADILVPLTRFPRDLPLFGISEIFQGEQKQSPRYCFGTPPLTGYLREATIKNYH